MAQPTAIKRRLAQPPAGSFEQLREEGIRLLQDLSGDHWTDYNLHDPGVTMLEALCFALTELIYRADFPVADFLAGKDGKIDFARQSLHPPELIYPCRPTTLEDYRRALLDLVSSAEGVSLSAGPDAGLMQGLYRIDVRPGDSNDQGRSVAEVLAAYRRLRNICEDVETVAEAGEIPCELVAEIEIGGGRDPVDILADVYDCCDRFIAAPPAYADIEAMVRAGRPLDALFDGPETRSGFIEREPSGYAASQLYVGDIARQVAAVEGVVAVKWLALAEEGGAPESGAVVWRRVEPDHSQKALRLRVPGGDQEQKVRLMRRGAPVRVSARDALLKFGDLRAARRIRRRAALDMNSACPRPVGTHVDLQRYYSAQSHFPPIYGLNRYGVPETATAREKAAVQQLKGFLAICDQVMAHAAAQLGHLRDLYTAGDGAAQSYWWQMLGDEEVPGMDSLYCRPAQEIRDEVYAPFDRYVERKDRVLDYLLALYGESYSQNSLRRFGGYYSDAELDNWLLRNKAAFAKDIVVLSRDRTGAFDYGRPAWEDRTNCAGLQRRVSLLLGFEDCANRALTAPIGSRGLSLPARGRAAPSHAGSPPETGAHRLIRLRLDGPESATKAAVDAQARSILRQPHLDALLAWGSRTDRYWLAHREAEDSWELVLGTDENQTGEQPERTLPLGSFASQREAAAVAARLRNFLVGLSHSCEGMHLVEHCLLRPVGSGGERSEGAAFFAHRLSCIFPAWTARTRNEHFRRFAEETVRINCPAHVYAQCLWLEYEAMAKFETCFEAWLKAKAEWSREPDSGEKIALVNRLADELIGELLGNGAEPRVSPEWVAHE